MTLTPLNSPGDTNVSCKSLYPNACEGWLMKLGGSGLTPRNWRRRWFVLKGFCLYYFKTPQDNTALGVITLPSFNIATASEIKWVQLYFVCSVFKTFAGFRIVTIHKLLVTFNFLPIFVFDSSVCINYTLIKLSDNLINDYIMWLILFS